MLRRDFEKDTGKREGVRETYLCGVEGAEREVSLRKLGDESGALSSQSITIYTNLINR